jgi:glycosyltransferase involved in cell wall biosynthesis
MPRIADSRPRARNVVTTRWQSDFDQALPTERIEGPRPRVSVGIPVYNGERFLAAALDSILGQTFQDFEVLVWDNASVDGSAEICRQYAARDPRVGYFQSPVNIGANLNFNRLVRMARGTYFKLANADDLSTPDVLARGVAILDAHPEVALCYGRTTLIGDDGEVIGAYDDGLDLRLATGSERFRAALGRIGLVNVLQGVIRMDALRRTALLGDYPGDDIVLVAELAFHGQFWELPDPCLYRRMHPAAGSAITRDSARQAHVAPLTKRDRLYLNSHRYLRLFASIWRGPLQTAEKLRLTGWLLRTAISAREEFTTECLRALRYGLGWLRGSVSGQ